MKKSGKTKIPAAAAIGILILLLTHASLSFQGACQGLLLWFHTVFPTLFPFMLCSNLIVMLDGVRLMTAPFSWLLRYGFGLTPDGGYVLLSGLLCGYPMGAKTCSEFLTQQRIEETEGKYLLAISNHPSPMFLLGYVASNLCREAALSRVLLAVYLPILPIAWLAKRFYGVTETKKRSEESRSSSRSNTGYTVTAQAQDSSSSLSFDDIMMSSFEVMVRIGGYIMIFSILAVFIQQLEGIPGAVKAIFLGIVEITTGIQAISSSIKGKVQGLCITAIVAFGGLSGIFQTRSVLKNAGLSIRHYVLWKTVHAVLSCFFYIGLVLL